MKRAITATAAGLALALGLGGCLTDAGQKETAGGLIGAALRRTRRFANRRRDGQLVAVGAGAVLGALMGSEVGRSLDKADELHAARNYQQALETAPTGTNLDLGESGHRAQRNPHADAHLPERNRPVLPRIPADRDHRRADRGSLWASLPRGRRRLENRQRLNAARRHREFDPRGGRGLWRPGAGRSARP